MVQPTEAQEASLDRLDEAMQKAVDTLREACPNTVPMTPVGRLEAMKQRLEAMIRPPIRCARRSRTSMPRSTTSRRPSSTGSAASRRNRAADP